MKCNKFRKYLIPFSEGTLPEGLSESLRSHASSCAACAHELEEIQGMVQVLQNSSYPSTEPAVGLSNRVVARITNAPAPKPSWQFIFKQYASAAAALAVCIVAINFAMMSSNQGPKIEKHSSTFTAQERERLESLGYLGGPTSKSADAPVPDMKSDGKHIQKNVQRTPGTRSMSHKPQIPRVAKRVATHPVMKAQPEPVQPSYRMFVKSYSPTVAEVNKTEIVDGDSSAYDRAAGAAPQITETFKRDQSAVPNPSQHMASKSVDAVVGICRDVPDSKKSVTNSLDFANPIFSNSDLSALEAKLKSSPNSQPVVLSLLNAYRDAGRSDEAFRMAQRLTKLDAHKAGYWLLLGQAAEASKRPRTALAAYDLAIRTGLADGELELAKTRIAALKETGGK